MNVAMEPIFTLYKKAFNIMFLKFDYKDLWKVKFQYSYWNIQYSNIFEYHPTHPTPPQFWHGVNIKCIKLPRLSKFYQIFHNLVWAMQAHLQRIPYLHFWQKKSHDECQCTRTRTFHTKIFFWSNIENSWRIPKRTPTVKTLLRWYKVAIILVA